jgi:hypothetical protein
MGDGVTLRGFAQRGQAVDASSRANADPYALQLSDGSWVGVGSELLGRDGSRDRMLYGASRTTCLRSEAELAGLL